ncbi:MAG: long-chain fatty acid--CoA ligase, partial [Xanthobacteraceae bacterium]
TSPAWLHAGIRLVDMLAFGEVALLGARRGPDGGPSPLPAGEVRAPRGSPHAVLLAEVARSEASTLALRGPMVPRHAFPPGAERLDIPCLRTDARGFVDTGYSCRIDPDTRHLVVTGPPPGIVSVGGYRFVLRELEQLVRRTDSRAIVTALPDALAGHRLAGLSGGSDDIGDALAALGASPLLIEAFRDRRSAEAA